MHVIEGHPGPAQALDVFVDATRASAEPGPAFVCESARTLRVDVDGAVWMKPGAAIAYRGSLRFERRPTLDADGPIDALLREVAPLVRVVGRGRLYCAHHAAHVRLVRLAGETVHVAWAEVLAFESALEFTPHLVAHGVSLAAGGLAVVRLSGHGVVALATHGQPIALQVTPEAPLSTDPHATLAWSDGLEPTLKADVSWRTLVAHGGGEPFQMHFAGHGFVLVQPFEDPSRLHLSASPLKRLASMITA
jgi:uncharacterized protein (AIM24 family)